MTAEPTTPSSLAPLPALPLRPAAATDPGLRERLGEFRALLVISLLMTESVDEDQILELAASSAPGLGPWRIDGYGFTNGSWRPGIDHGTPIPSDLAGQPVSLGDGPGIVELPGRGGAWAFP